MRRTLFSLLLKERDLLRWEVFCVRFAAAGRELASETGNRARTCTTCRFSASAPTAEDGR